MSLSLTDVCYNTVLLLPSHTGYWLHAPLSCSVGCDQVTDSDSVLKIADQLLVELRLLKKENPAKEVLSGFTI